jgi:hypothetical protein
LIINLDHFFGSIGISLCRQIIGIITKIAICYATGDFYFTVVGLLFCLVDTHIYKKTIFVNITCQELRDDGLPHHHP